MQQSASLIEVDCVGHICRNHLIVVPWFGDAIHLDSKQNWNFFLLQLAGQRNNSSAAPAVSEQDNVCATLVLVRHLPVPAGVKPSKNGLMRSPAVPVLKHRDTK